MNLTDYLVPVSSDLISVNKEGSIGNTIMQYNNGVPDFEISDSVRIAILGVPEDRFSDGAGEIKSPAQIRKQLYALMARTSGDIIDLGNLRAGKTLADTYFGMRHVLTELYEHNLVTLIIGGTMDVFYGNYLALDGQPVNITFIAPQLRLPVGETELQPFNSLVFEKNEQPIHVCNIGYQSYYVSQQDLELFKCKHFELYRLGEAKAGNIRENEPVIRDSDLIALSMNAVKYSDAPAASFSSPNGFTGEEACQLAFYAGLGYRCKSMGIFDMIPHNDSQYITAKLASQIAWYFIEGVKQRNTDNPKSFANNFKKYVIYFDQLHHNLCFFKNIKTERWWMEVPSLKNEQDNVFISCTQEDYTKATEQEIPDRWWKMYQRIN